MDLKFFEDEADLSVGLSVTCSTTEDLCYGSDGPHLLPQPDTSPSPLYLMQYPTENNLHPAVHSSDIDFDQSLMMGGVKQEQDGFEEDLHDVIDLDDYRYNRQRKEEETYVSAIRLHPDARKMQVCKTCGKTFKFQTSLLRHNNKVHMSRYQCSTCCRLFSRQSYLDVHTSKPGTSCYIEHKLNRSKRRN